MAVQTLASAVQSGLATEVGAGLGASAGLGAALGPIGLGLGLASALFGGGGGVRPPPPRSYLGEMRKAIGGQRDVLPDVISGEYDAAAAYQKLQQQTLMGQLGVMQNLYGAYAPAAAQIAGQNLSQFAPMYGQAAGYATGAMRQGIGEGGMGLLNTLTSQAQQDLSAGGALTPEQLSYAQQSARMASSARGLASSNLGIANEILNTYNVRRAREDRARKFAQEVYGLQQNLASTGAQLYGQPIMSLASSVSPTALLGQSLQYQSSQGPQFMQPESQYMANLMGSNQNAALSANLANAQIRAGVGSGLMSAAGNVFSGYATGRGQAGLPLFG